MPIAAGSSPVVALGLSGLSWLLSKSVPVFILLYRFIEVPLNVAVGLPATRRLFRPRAGVPGPL
jgi:hypothetical protein